MPKVTEYTLNERDRYNLEQLRKKLKSANFNKERLAELLAEAINIADHRDDGLTESIRPITEKAISSSIHNNPETLSTALFPIIGSAIRKALNRMLADMMAQTNNSLESVFSVRRLSWRLEAKKTGLPYYEVVLRHNLLYRVKHAFLIHKKTGLLLLARSAQGEKTADDDMVASMLTAVQSYIRDSLSLDSNDVVDGISAGEYSIQTEDSPEAILALIIQGTADVSLHETMSETLEAIHTVYGRALQSFNGNTAVFEGAAPALDACLTLKEKNNGPKKPVYSIILLCILLSIMGFFGVKGFLAHRERTNFIQSLDHQPGIVLLSHSRFLGRSRLRILYDERAPSIQDYADEQGFDLSSFNVESEAYLSPHFSQLMSIHPTEEAIPAELLILAEELHEYTIFFEQDSGELAKGQETALLKAGRLVSLLVEKAETYGIKLSIEITGHSAGTVDDEASYEISEARAQKAYDAFVSLNAPLANYVRARGVGIHEPRVPVEITEEDRIKNRSVSFKTVFE